MPNITHLLALGLAVGPQDLTRNSWAWLHVLSCVQVDPTAFLPGLLLVGLRRAWENHITKVYSKHLCVFDVGCHSITKSKSDRQGPNPTAEGEERVSVHSGELCSHNKAVVTIKE